MANKDKSKIRKGVGVGVLCAVFLTLAFLGGYFVRDMTLDEGLRTLLWVKKTIGTYYNYPLSDEEFYAAALNGVNGVLDNYSYYMSKEEYTDYLTDATGEWCGLGITFSTKDENYGDRILMSRISGNSPAEKAGLKEGYYILGFGEVGGEITPCTKFDAFSAFLAGKEKDEEFVVRVRKGEEGAEEADYLLKKESFIENYVFYRSSTSAYRYGGEFATEKESYDGNISALPSDTAYIRLTQFNGNAATEFASAMEIFKEEGKKNLILDLRSNGGGYMSILCSIASYFCKGATENRPIIAKANYAAGRTSIYRADKNVYADYFGEDSSVYVLADDSTASASECLIGCMLDYETVAYGNIVLSERTEWSTDLSGEIVGKKVKKTFGKGIMQATYERNWTAAETEAVKLTCASIVWPISGNCIHGVGILEEDGTLFVGESTTSDKEISDAISLIFS